METDPTNELIIEVAKELIRERGLKITITEIAKAASISRPTIYARYENTEEIITEVLTRDLLAMLDNQKLPENRAELVNYIVSTTKKLSKSKLLQAIIMQEPQMLLTYQFVRLGRTQKEFIDFIEYLIERCEGVRRNNPKQTAAFVLFAVQGAATMGRAATNIVTEKEWETELSRMLEGYLRP